jgi:ribonuclease D
VTEPLAAEPPVTGPPPNDPPPIGAPPIGPPPAQAVAFELVDEPGAWRSALERLRAAPRLALDLEADGYHRYPERLSLVQLALDDGLVFLVDPLALGNLPELGELLADPARPKVLHSADYDIRMLDRHLGFRLRNLYDSSIAAQFAGSRRLGLGNVLAEFEGLTLHKPRRLQTLDWSQRPLAEDALAYAAGDVAFLLPLADTLAGRLAALGRVDWAAEECERLEQVRYVPPEPPEKAFLATPGARDLPPQGLAVLRELVVFRDEEALRIGRPPHHVMSNAALVTLAANPKADVNQVGGMGRRTLSGEVRQRLLAAISRGLRSEPVPWPRRAGENAWTPEARRRLTRLKQWRTREAERLDLDPGVIWPAAHLDQVALHPDRALEDLDKGEPPWVRRWQWQVLGPSLAHFRTTGLDDPAAE